MGRRPSSAAFAAGVAVVASLVAPAMGADTSDAPRHSATAARAAPLAYLRAAHYFGREWPVNFWNSDLATVADDFRRIKDDGFNAIVLVVPWGEFQPETSPIRYNGVAFARLAMLLRKAHAHGLKVILRVGYAWSFHPRDELPGRRRLVAVYGSGAVYRAWLSYMRTVYEHARRSPAYAFSFFSWEDVWEIVPKAASLRSRFARVAFARKIGFQRYLRSRYRLADVAAAYRARFDSWDEIPTPRRRQRAFQLFFRFVDSRLVQRFYSAARARIPGLSLAVRVDADAIYAGRRRVGWYSHAGTYDRPESPFTTLYFAPAFGASTTAPASAETGLARLAVQLELVQGASRKPLFLSEFAFADNTPPHWAPGTRIAARDVARFVVGSAPLLRKHCLGFGIWTYRDYRANAIFNPSFALGLAGWKHRGATRIVRTRDGRALLLRAGAAVEQAIEPSRNDYDVYGRATLSVRARGGSDARLAVTLAGRATRTLRISRTLRTHLVPLRTHGVRNYDIRLQAVGASLQLDDVRLFSFVQRGDITRVDGSPGPALRAVRRLNALLGRAE